MTKLGRFCLYTPLLVAFASIIISCPITLVIIRDSSDLNGMAFPIVIGINIIASLCSYTIALNFFKKVRDNIIISGITFYFPAIFLISFINTLSLGQDLIFSIAMYLPFIIPQTFFFIYFRKRLKSGEILDDYYEW